MDVVGYDVGVVGELFIADSALAVLGDDLPVPQLSHFAFERISRYPRG